MEKSTRAAVVIADSTEEGSRVFGRFFDHLRLGTHDVLEEMLQSRPAVVALTGAGLLPTLDRILAKGPRGMQELHLRPTEDLLDQVCARLAASPDWALIHVGRCPDGAAVLVASPAAPGSASEGDLPVDADLAVPGPTVTLQLSMLRPYTARPARWPEALTLKNPKQPGAARRAAAPAPAPAPQGGLLQRYRKLLALAGIAVLVAIVVLVALALVGGYEAVVIGLLIGMLLVLGAAALGVAYCVRLLRSLAHQQHAVTQDVAQLHASVDDVFKRQRKVMRQVHRIDRAVPILTARQIEMQEYVAEFAGRVAEAEATAAERDGVLM
jgi:cell division protein FtsB